MADLLDIPHGMTFDTLLSTWPAKPLPNIAAFDTLKAQGLDGQIRGLNYWIEPQQVCNVIIKHHGANGLRRVLKGIAEASSVKKIPMGMRVRVIAEYYELETY